MAKALLTAAELRISHRPGHWPLQQQQFIIPGTCVPLSAPKSPYSCSHRIVQRSRRFPRLAALCRGIVRFRWLQTGRLFRTRMSACLLGRKRGRTHHRLTTIPSLLHALPLASGKNLDTVHNCNRLQRLPIAPHHPLVLLAIEVGGSQLRYGRGRWLSADDGSHGCMSCTRHGEGTTWKRVAVVVEDCGRGEEEGALTFAGWRRLCVMMLSVFVCVGQSKWSLE